MARILVVEDEALLLSMVTELLKLNGHEVSGAADGHRGWEMASTVQFDLVILDIQLPGRDGWSILASLKKDAVLQNMPVVMWTGRPSEQGRQKALEMGAVACLEKPVSADDLLDTIRAALSAK